MFSSMMRGKGTFPPSRRWMHQPMIQFTHAIKKGGGLPSNSSASAAVPAFQSIFSSAASAAPSSVVESIVPPRFRRLAIPPEAMNLIEMGGAE